MFFSWKHRTYAVALILFLFALGLLQVFYFMSLGTPKLYYITTENSILSQKKTINIETTSKDASKTDKYSRLLLTQLYPEKDIFKNLTEPYYNTIKDEGFPINSTYFQLAEAEITTIPENFILSGSNICEKDIPSILFIIPSVAKSDAAKERLDIRKTWASNFYDTKWRQNSSTRLAFFFGGSGLKPVDLQALKNESATFGDIVVGDFVDSYANLSLKMATTITWVARNCPSIKAAVKLDIDTFVNVDLLLGLIEKVPVNTYPKYVLGYQHAAIHPPAERKGVWEVPATVYPFDKFPRYVYGHSYVISGPALKQMAESFPHFPIVPNEDAFVTGIMAVTLNIIRYYHTSFATLVEKRTICKMIYNFYVTSLVDKDDRCALWDSFKTGECIDEEL